jgi:carboxypeptidase Taq
MTAAGLYEQYTAKMQKIADLKYAAAVLQWDQETYLPAKGAILRGQQIATLSEMAHELFTDAALGECLDQLKDNPELDIFQHKNIWLTLEDYNKNKRYPSAFVRQMSEATNRGYHAWIKAGKENNFSVFEPALDEVIQLKKEEAALLGFEQHPYDALLNEYEKGATVQMLDTLFEGIREPLKALLDKIMACNMPDDAFLHQSFPKQTQWDFGMFIIKELGFDFEGGRQDISTHPFTINFSSEDVRITTRIDENDFSNMTWSCIHETGHALYEQGLPVHQYGLPLGAYTSLGIHESQSRLWENNVGRSIGFWKYYYPLLQGYFPLQLGSIPLEQFYRGINKIQPSLIRTEADELTYHFHVMIRYELEKLLIDGSLSTRDIPDFWNEHYRRYLGVSAPDHRQGCLQDVHWGHGSFGYFPTYSLGSFYAAQFFASANKAIPALSEEIEAGNTKNLLSWLRKSVHSHGRFYTSNEMCHAITGEPLKIDYFMQYLLKKYQDIYHF